MKKILLLIAMTVTSYNLFAFTTMGVWRWRNDDGSEASATWKAAQNTAIIISETDVQLRLRIEQYNNGGDGLGGLILEDSVDGVAGWHQVTLTAGTNAFILAGTSAFVNDLEATTHQLSGQTTPFTFTPGHVMVSSEEYPDGALGAGLTTEIEYVLKTTANIQPNTTYFFRTSASTYPFAYVYPSVSTAEVLAVKYSAFTAGLDKDNRVKLSWQTASEENCDRFDVERSTDALTYKTIASIKGNGTSSVSHDYTAYDDAPFSGTNYYRLKQYDYDGKFHISAVRAVTISGLTINATVYPNPSKGDISFTLPGYSGAVTALLTNISGKTIHQQVIQANASGTSYKLNVSTKPAPGTYILQLKGNGLSKNIKVSIQ